MITVLIPTYRRPDDLRRCLTALKHQTRPVDELILVVRDTDHQTWSFIEQFDAEKLPLRTVTIAVSGVVAALNSGFAAAQGDIIAVTDDDAAPHPDWLERMEAHYRADDRVGGVGGRDWVYLGHNLLTGSCAVVGKIQWFGRMIGNHHLGTGTAREVDVLKGVNMSFRRVAIQGIFCDQRLKGTGAQVHFELALSLSVKQQGWKLIYDPAVAVDHFPAQRFDEDQRSSFNYSACCNRAHNEALALFSHLSPPRRIAYLLWSGLIGTRDTPGLVQFFRVLPEEGALALQKLQAAIQGRWQAWRTWNEASS